MFENMVKAGMNASDIERSGAQWLLIRVEYEDVEDGLTRINFLGAYDTADEALDARDSARVELPPTWGDCVEYRIYATGEFMLV